MSRVTATIGSSFLFLPRQPPELFERAGATGHLRPHTTYLDIEYLLESLLPCCFPHRPGSILLWVDVSVTVRVP